MNDQGEGGDGNSGGDTTGSQGTESASMSANTASETQNDQQVAQTTYADYAYEHVSANENDPARAATLDRRADDAGFSSANEYIDDIQGRDDTRSFEAANDRVCWANSNERLYGWNNRADPTQSTVIPKKTPELTTKEFENHKEAESEKLNEQVHETGSLTHQQRNVELDQKSLENDQAPRTANTAEETRSSRLQDVVDTVDERDRQHERGDIER